MPICRQDHLSAVTFQDNEMFHELCGKIEKLVHYKIEHFRLVDKSHGISGVLFLPRLEVVFLLHAQNQTWQ